MAINPETERKARDLYHRIFAPNTKAREAEEKDTDYRARQKKELDAIDASTDEGSKGVDAGELGKKWDEQFK